MIVLITGASSGFGEAMARKFVQHGHRVIATARRADRLARLHEALGDSLLPLVMDVADPASIEEAFRHVPEDWQAVDVLINNAGLGGEVDVVDMSDEQWFRVLDVTLNSVFRMSRAFLPAMYARQSGVIVNNASVLGWRAQKGQAHYAAAKAGVMAFTRCAAVEAAEHNVRINAVAPSIAMHAFLAKVTTDELLAELSAKEAFGRPAEVWEVANVMLFLASDLSSYMTGEVLSVSSQRA